MASITIPFMMGCWHPERTQHNLLTLPGRESAACRTASRHNHYIPPLALGGKPCRRCSGNRRWLCSATWNGQANQWACNQDINLVTKA